MRADATKTKKPALSSGFLDGARETRTPDLLGAIQALSQLSYSPGGRPIVAGSATSSRARDDRAPRSCPSAPGGARLASSLRAAGPRRLDWRGGGRRLAEAGVLVLRYDARLVLGVRDRGAADEDPEDENPHRRRHASPERIGAVLPRGFRRLLSGCVVRGTRYAGAGSGSAARARAPSSASTRASSGLIASQDMRSRFSLKGFNPRAV